MGVGALWMDGLIRERLTGDRNERRRRNAGFLDFRGMRALMGMGWRQKFALSGGWLGR